MKSRKFFWLALIAIMALVLVACDSGGDDDDGGDDDGGGDAQGVELSQEVSFEDPDAGYTITVSYPEGWAASNDSGILLANSEDVLAMIGDSEAVPESGQIGGGFSVLDTTVLEILELDASDLEAIVTSFAEDFEVGEPTTTEINGTSVASVTATGTVGSGEGEFLVAAIAVEGGVAIANFASGPGGLESETDTLLAIVASAQVSGLATE